MRDAAAIATGKLYDQDAYMTEFSAEVVSFENGDLGLDQTAFFPEEGGQSPDKGLINGFPVTDVQIKDGQIHHTIGCKEDGSVASFSEGERVEGLIDWKNRFSNMQQHSGEHLFSGIAFYRHGIANVGFHLSEREMTVDTARPVTEEELAEIEREVNEAIALNVETKIDFLEGEALKEASFRSKIDFSGVVRVVTFPGIDACACCAPHVRHTGEIGCLKVVSFQKYKQGSRIYLLCGLRAIDYLANEHRVMMKTANYLSTGIDEVYGQVVKLKEDLAESARTIRRMASEALMQKAAALGEDEIPCFFTEEADAAALREAVNYLTARRSGVCAVFAGSAESGYSYVAGSSTADMRAVQKDFQKETGARGGGSDRMVQGKVTADPGAIMAFFAGRQN